MQANLGKRLFTFAVVSDSHVNEAEDRSASPYPSNRLANGRFRFVVDQLRREAPAFVVHLGDAGNPLPELGTYDAAAANFKSLAGGLDAPLHIVPGNHCVGDKPQGWVPVPRVAEGSLESWESHFGRDHWAFDHGPCRFVGLDSLLLDSGLLREKAQRRWFEAELAAGVAAGQRLFVFMHYSAYVADPDEPASYDNLDPPARGWLLDLLSRHGVEAAFSGHVHNFFYNRRAGTDLYTLPATSFVRQDYSELYAVAPADGEGGRDDPAKLGYGLVRVYEGGHAPRIVRTHGATLAPSKEAPRPHLVSTVTRREREHPGVGVEMRDNWLARVALRTNNSVSPFRRRWARNDWALLALEEAGLSRVRFALEELSEPGTPERLEVLNEIGFEFTAYSLGVPTEVEIELLTEHRTHLAGWELIAWPEELETAAAVVRELCGRPGEQDSLPCFWNEVRDVESAQIDDANVKHVANYGFQPHDLERAAGLWTSGLDKIFSGLVFRLRRREKEPQQVWQSIREIAGLAEAHGMANQVHLLFSGNVTAERFADDPATANRVAEATLAASLTGHVDLYFDTFEDIDRGYFVRNGLVDRRANPRLALRVLAHLNAALFSQNGGSGRLSAAADWRAIDLEDARIVSGPHRGGWLALVLTRGSCQLSELDVNLENGTPARKTTLVDLENGALSEPAALLDGPRLVFDPPLELQGPALIRLGLL